MATIASNQLGIYALDGGSTTPLVIYENAADPTSVPSGVTANQYFIHVDGSGVFQGVWKVDGAGTGVSEVSDSDWSGGLLAAATTTTLDTSNTINEVAARNGSGGSTNYIASGAFSWNYSIDGLIDLTSGSGSAVTLMDISRDSKYVVTLFTTDVNTSGTNRVKYVGQALIESASLTGGVDDIATYSATLRGYGDLYKY